LVDPDAAADLEAHDERNYREGDDRQRDPANGGERARSQAHSVDRDRARSYGDDRNGSETQHAAADQRRVRDVGRGVHAGEDQGGLYDGGGDDDGDRSAEPAATARAREKDAADPEQPHRDEVPDEHPGEPAV